MNERNSFEKWIFLSFFFFFLAIFSFHLPGFFCCQTAKHTQIELIEKLLIIPIEWTRKYLWFFHYSYTRLVLHVDEQKRKRNTKKKNIKKIRFILLIHIKYFHFNSHGSFFVCFVVCVRVHFAVFTCFSLVFESSFYVICKIQLGRSYDCYYFLSS